MEASRLTIECRSFRDLKDLIRAACGARDASWTSPQFEYIQSYLQRKTARAKTIVIEKPYVDRHYLEEYGAYYFSAFRNGGPKTTRIHFFDTEFALSLKCYLHSGIPAVLVLEDPRGGYHAVAASGYRLGDDEEPAADIKVKFLDEGGELSSKGMSRIYVQTIDSVPTCG